MLCRFRRIILLSAIGFFVATVTWAQSNDRIDELLAQDPAQTDLTAYLILSAAELVDENVAPQEAVDYAIAEGMLSAGTDAAEAVTFGRFSYLLMRSFGVPGGVMYRLVPGPRYAAREVVFQKWSRMRRDTDELLDGETVLRILSVYLNEQGGAR